MHGAGSFPAGFGPAGVDPLPVPFGTAPPRSVVPPAALWFDGATQDFLLDPTTGLYVPLHPVDQQVALALLVNLGSVSSATGVGAAFRSITRITPSTKTQVTRAASNALASLVQARLVQVDDIAVSLLAFGGFAVAVSYENLVTRKSPTFMAPQGTFTGTE